MLGDGLANGLNNTGVDVEEILAGHARLPWHTSRNENHVSTLEGTGQLIRPSVTLDLYGGGDDMALHETCIEGI